MKKFYALFAAALMSVSMFAQAPTQAELQSYMQTGYYVACFSTPTQGTCNDIVWIGTYNGWNADDPDKIVCQELPNHAGWYVAVVPVAFGEDGVTPNNHGKPVQLNECGKFSWTYQCGYYGSIEFVAGEVTIASGNGYTDAEGVARNETDLKDWSTTEPTIITMSAWKNSPCNNVCNEHAYTIRLFDPFCDSHPEFAPTIMGSFNNWGGAAAMELREEIVEGEPVSVWVYTTPEVGSDLEFKFNNDANGGWDNQFEYYVPADEDNDVPGAWKQFGNFTLASTEYMLDATTFEFDFSDETKYRYAQCSADTNTYSVTVNMKSPAGAPAAGVEMGGSFASADWSVFQAMTLGADGVTYTATLPAKAGNEFKFREAGSWANEIVELKDGDWKSLDNIKFGEVWTAGEGNAKVINLDYTDAAKYAWKANTQGIENVQLTEKAQKVVVDGVMYIIRDNKMFNVQGTQVR